ncbi:MAG: glycosyltransferase family 4 protein [Opitutales bacterium]|nr:glycosyltransferase family 4 protein [Opitutales bacterium]
MAQDNFPEAQRPYDRILMVTHEFAPTPGGIATYCEETALAAARAGWTVDIAAPRNALPARDAPYGLYRLPVNGTQGWFDRLRLGAALRRLPIPWESTLLYLPEPAPLRLYMYARWLKLPRPAALVLTLHGSEIRLLGDRFHRRQNFGRLCASADRIGVVSDFVRQELLRRYPGLAPKLVHVPGAVRSDLQQLARQRPPVPKIKKDGRPFDLLSVARIHPRKGLDLAIKALARLPDDLKRQIHYRVVGPLKRKGHAQSLHQAAERAGLSLTFMGTVSLPELGRLYAEADLLLFPSRELPKSVEGLGLTILEAAAFGLPAIATATGGTRETIRDGHTGRLIKPGDPAAFAAAVAELLQNRSIRNRLANKAPEHAASFSWDANSARLFAHSHPG